MLTLSAASFGANLILGFYLLVATVGIVVGFFTVRGSGINNHPCDGSHAPPGSRLPDEFHQFADRQLHQADMRRVDVERAVDARLARVPANEPAGWHAPHISLPRLRHVERLPSDDMSLEEVNRALAAEASARTTAKDQEQEHTEAR
jgi:hypothetical protein